MIITITNHNSLPRLARYGGVQPIGSRQGNVNVEGRTWELWVGMNGSMKVFSFVAANPVNNFNSDVKQFYNYLANTQGFPISKQYLLSMLTPRNALLRHLLIPPV